MALFHGHLGRRLPRAGEEWPAHPTQKSTQELLEWQFSHTQEKYKSWHCPHPGVLVGGSHITIVWSSGPGPWGKTPARSTSFGCTLGAAKHFGLSSLDGQVSYPHGEGFIAGQKHCDQARRLALPSGLLCPWSLTLFELENHLKEQSVLS